MKQNLPTVRQFGQSSLTSSFLSKSRLPNEGTESRPSKKPISLSDFLNRKVLKTDSKSIKEKQTSFSSIGSDDKMESECKKGEVGGGFVLSRAVFQRFNQPLMKDGNGRAEEESQAEPNGEENGSRKRKNPFEVSSDELTGEDEKPQAKKYLVVLGDDPKPKPKPKPRIRERKLPDERPKPFYNHYENGSGWWDGDKEGVDSEEVGCNDAWEGMGSTTLGGLEWH